MDGNVFVIGIYHPIHMIKAIPSLVFLHLTVQLQNATHVKEFQKDPQLPHFTIDYSPNLEAHVDIAGLCDCLRLTAIETGVFPLAGVRVRAFAASHVSIADGNPKHGYIDISVRLRAGRDLQTRRDATQTIFTAAKSFLAPVMQQRPVALSFEMRDIDPELSPKCGTIRDHLEDT